MIVKLISSLLALLILAGPLPADADSADNAVMAETPLQQWRLEKAESLWREVNHEPGPMPPANRAAAIDGDFSGLFDPHVSGEAYVVSGTPDIPVSPAAMLMLGDGELFWPHCSAVLTRPDTLLTAAHCVRNRPAGASWKVFLPYEGIRDLASAGITLPCDDASNACSDDIAIIRLAEPYAFVPVAQQAPPDLAAPGSVAFAQGFGAASDRLLDQGLAHGGTVVLDECGCSDDYEGPGRLLCFELDYGEGFKGVGNFIGRNGDSGGPLFTATGPPFLLAGIAAGVEKSCDGGNRLEGRYTDVRAHEGKPWLTAAFCEPDCQDRGLPDEHVLLRVDLAYVSSEIGAGYGIRLDRNVRALILNLNHETAGFQPEPATDLSIVLPRSLEGECSRYYGVESCHVSNPPPGAYRIGIKRESGNPAYQLTVIAIHNE